MSKSIPLLPNNLHHKDYWTSTGVKSWSIESFDLYWIQQNPRLCKKISRAHTSLGKELDLLFQSSDQQVVEKAQLLKRQLKNGSSTIDNIIWNRSEEIVNSHVCLTYSEFLAKINIKTNIVDNITNSEERKRKHHNDYDVSFDKFIDRSSEEKETGKTAVKESCNDKLVEMALGTRNLKNIKGDEDESSDIESKNQNDNDVPASSNNGLEKVEDGENIDIDLESIVDELQCTPKDVWYVGTVNVTERFRWYQEEVIKKAKSEGLTYKNIYEVLALSSVIVFCWPCPYPVFTNQEWLEITKSNPYTLNELPLLPEISNHLINGTRRHLANKDTFLDGGKPGLSGKIACLFNGLYNSLPAVAPLKISEVEHCYRFLYPITCPFFLGPQKEYKMLLNYSTGDSRKRLGFACVVNDIPILISEIKPLGYTPLQQKKDNLKVQLQARKSINQQLLTKGGPGEAAIFVNMGTLMESYFMDLKYDGLYRSWPFLTTRLVTDRTTIPLMEFAISHLMALEEQVGKIAMNYKYRATNSHICTDELHA
ncbi:2223_t:CDS:10 [Paraglomus brasilianum]|uniref:2223_t:CDS:1 n=1 Tax=Paraglomus brasilianum TaxID=144538 RepID=A0A9N8Z4S6_9GLOM|nr:2223_t:CDS:10 [Paraglomus brasilianum]